MTGCAGHLNLICKISTLFYVLSLSIFCLQWCACVWKEFRGMCVEHIPCCGLAR